MIDSKRLLLGASAALLAPLLGLPLAPAIAQTGAAAPAAAPATPTTPEQARADMEKRMEAAMAERDKRYAELRKRAAEVGLELPETPPWAQAGMPPKMPTPDMPQPPAMPEGMPQPPAMPEGMAERKPMTREEFEAMRLERWEAMRERAKAMGRELPETPPWEAAEQRRKELLEKYEAYKATIEAMTDEQKEAIAALFGGRAAEAPPMPPRPMGGPMGNCRKGGQPCGRGMMPGYDVRPGMGPGMGPGMYPGSMPMMPGADAPAAPPAGDAGAAAPATEPAAPSDPAG